MSQGSAEQNTGKVAEAPAPGEPAVLVRSERQALFMAACIFFITAACWGAAEFACNKHPPQFKEPTALTQEQLAATAKDAAIELEQRLLSGDLPGALALVDDPLAEQIKKAVAECQAAGSCNSKAGVVTRAEVLRFESPAVVVRTISQQGGKESRALLKMEKRGAIWKASSRETE